MLPLGQSVQGISIESAGQVPGKPDVSNIVGKLDDKRSSLRNEEPPKVATEGSEADSFSEHDSIDSYEQITVKPRDKADADQARALYETLDRYNSVVVPKGELHEHAVNLETPVFVLREMPIREIQKRVDKKLEEMQNPAQ